MASLFLWNNRVFIRLVLPDGPTARGATTSWWVCRSCGDDVLGASRCSAHDPDQREDRCCLVRLDQLKGVRTPAPRVVGPSGGTGFKQVLRLRPVVIHLVPG